jgi:nucleoside triphosphate pyrophosphatase
MRLVLASRSPRRAELLIAAGFRFETLAVDVDERVRGAEPPADYVRRLASEKSARVFDLLQADGKRHGTADVVVLGADTAVVVGGVILGKPLDDADAAQMLRRLAGRTHEVLTAVSLRGAGWERSDVAITAVEVAALSDEDIAWYVASGEGRDKAGAYAIQGLAARFIPRIEGSYSNVVGLPIATVHALVAEIALRPLSRLS